MRPRIRQELRDVDPNLPILKIDTLEEQLDDVLAQERLMATLSAVFGSLATALACLGVYGVMSYTVVGRTNEIGIRMALGAKRGDVVQIFVKDSLVIALGGIAIGMPVTLAASRLIAHQLFGVNAGDPVTVVGVLLLMITVTVLAGLLPARRAARVDPLLALRHD
jgi:ABC-type antimicrobial peptide transport system permease subunit